MTHELKIWPEYFVAVERGNKCFELRKDDREFQVGDYIKLREYDPREQRYTGEARTRRVFYILRDSPGLEKGYCILGL